MLRRQQRDGDPGSEKPVGKRVLAATMIQGNIVYTTDAAWAWFEVPTQRWAFRGDGVRLELILDMVGRLGALQGRELHVRVTSQPVDGDRWVRDLVANTLNPLPSYRHHLACVREHLADGVGARKRVYIGVRVAARQWATRALDSVRGRAAQGLQVRVDRETVTVAEALAGQGIEAAPAGPAAMEWLMRRSIELGMPVPEELSPATGGTWGAGDLSELTENVDHEASLLADEVKVLGRARLAGVERWVSVLTVGRIDEIEVPDPGRTPWLAETDRLGFPVEWSMRLRILDGMAAREEIQKKLLVIRDMQRHYADHDLDEPLALERQARMAREAEDEMTTGRVEAATRVHGWFRVAVWGSTVEEVRERARQVADRYRKRQVTIAHPKGQAGLLREFIPGEPLSSTAYQRRMPALYFASGVPTVAASLGDGRGPYIGHTSAGSRQAVMFDTHYATEVRETSGLVPIVGGLGAGKSVLAGLITYEAVRRGITSVMLDPSGPLARLCTLPELRGRARHIDLTSAPSGALNPFGVIAEPRAEDYDSADALEEARTLARQDRKQLALDIATMLLPADLSRKGRTRLLLTEAVRTTGGARDGSLWAVVEHLEQRDVDGRDIAVYLRDMAEMPLARLFFPVAERGSRPDLDAVLTVLTMPGLILPPGSVPREHWSTTEQLAVPLLHLASWYASRTIYGRPRNERKLVALDEIHFLGEWGAGRALFNRLGRDSRKWNTCVLAASQNPADVLGMEVSNFISAAFVGRIEDEEIAGDALRMLRVPPGVGYEGVLAKLSTRPARGERSGYREFVMRDVNGDVDRMRVDLDHLPQVLAALDTTASPGTAVAERSAGSGPEVRSLELGVA